MYLAAIHSVWSDRRNLWSVSKTDAGEGYSWYRQLLEGAKEYITMDLSVDEMERMNPMR